MQARHIMQLLPHTGLLSIKAILSVGHTFSHRPHEIHVSSAEKGLVFFANFSNRKDTKLDFKNAFEPCETFHSPFLSFFYIDVFNEIYNKSWNRPRIYGEYNS